VTTYLDSKEPLAGDFADEPVNFGTIPIPILTLQTVFNSEDPYPVPVSGGNMYGRCR
jgi:hypothetical protein